MRELTPTEINCLYMAVGYLFYCGSWLLGYIYVAAFSFRFWGSFNRTRLEMARTLASYRVSAVNLKSAIREARDAGVSSDIIERNSPKNRDFDEEPGNPENNE